MQMRVATSKKSKWNLRGEVRESLLNPQRARIFRFDFVLGVLCQLDPLLRYSADRSNQVGRHLQATYITHEIVESLR